jgi:hypothetical protein
MSTVPRLRPFQDKFDKYKAALDKTPAAWRGVGAEVTRTRTAFEAVAEGIGVADYISF